MSINSDYSDINSIDIDINFDGPCTRKDAEKMQAVWEDVKAGSLQEEDLERLRQTLNSPEFIKFTEPPKSWINNICSRILNLFFNKVGKTSADLVHDIRNDLLVKIGKEETQPASPTGVNQIQEHRVQSPDIQTLLEKRDYNACYKISQQLQEDQKKAQKEQQSFHEESFQKLGELRASPQYTGYLLRKVREGKDLNYLKELSQQEESSISHIPKWEIYRSLQKYVKKDARDGNAKYLTFLKDPSLFSQQAPVSSSSANPLWICKYVGTEKVREYEFLLQNLPLDAVQKILQSDKENRPLFWEGELTIRGQAWEKAFKGYSQEELKSSSAYTAFLVKTRNTDFLKQDEKLIKSFSSNKPLQKNDDDWIWQCQQLPVAVDSLRDNNQLFQLFGKSQKIDDEVREDAGQVYEGFFSGGAELGIDIVGFLSPIWNAAVILGKDAFESYVEKSNLTEENRTQVLEKFKKFKTAFEDSECQSLDDFCANQKNFELLRDSLFPSSGDNTGFDLEDELYFD